MGKIPFGGIPSKKTYLLEIISKLRKFSENVELTLDPSFVDLRDLGTKLEKELLHSDTPVVK